VTAPRETSAISDPFWRLNSASTTLLKFVESFAGLKPLPVLDAGCGFGRNAGALALRGLDVVCADADVARLTELVTLSPSYCQQYASADQHVGRLYPLCAHLDAASWPFSDCAFSAITCIHFLPIHLLDTFRRSLIPGGFLFIETFGGQGRNYVNLPRRGELRDLLRTTHDLLFYKERAVGPPDVDAVSVKLLARQRAG
jgi:SAM-dependent methyltransferase